MYVRTIVPIGVLYTGSLVFSNLVYLYLSVAFAQMLKAASSVAVLCTSWAFGVAEPNLGKFLNILVIVFGVIIASFGEINFSMIGFVYLVLSIVFEAVRLVMIQVMLTAEGMKMDPLVALYYYAPVCAFFNIIVALFTEVPSFKYEDIANISLTILFLNASVAFLLNIASVLLVSKLVQTDQKLYLTILDWQNLRPRPHPRRHPQGHPPRRRLRHRLEDADLQAPGSRLWHRPPRSLLLLPRL